MSSRRVPGFTPSPTLCRVLIAVAAISVATGAWNVFVLHRQRPGIFWQLVFPLIVLRLTLTLYRRSRRVHTMSSEPPAGAG